MIPVALQLYSVRQDAAADLPDTIARAGAMGYDGVEFAGFFDHAPAAIVDALHTAGVRCAGSHCPWSRLHDDQLEATLAYHRAIDCPFVIIPSLPPETHATPEDVTRTAARLTVLCDRVQDAGMKLGFHAHAGDMKPGADGRSFWEALAAGTPDAFLLQYDTANGMDAGADAVAPILDHPARAETVHLKEYRIGGGHGQAVLGEGDVPWDRVLDACEAASTQWYVIECEGHPTLSPMDTAAASLRNLQAIRARRAGGG